MTIDKNAVAARLREKMAKPAAAKPKTESVAAVETRLKAKRTNAKAVTTATSAAADATKQMVELSSAMDLVKYQVQVVGHALVKAKSGDKPKKDSIWGFMTTKDHVIKFFGRRGSTLRYKQEPIANLKAAQDLYVQKLAGTDAKKLKHEDANAMKQVELMGQGWPESLFANYEKALAEGKVDQYVAAKPQTTATVSEQPEQSQSAWRWPKAADFIAA